mgnify:CR=1 FL=1
MFWKCDKDHSKLTAHNLKDTLRHTQKQNLWGIAWIILIMAKIVSDILISPMNTSVIQKEMPFWDENTDQQHGKIQVWARLSLS